MAGMWFWWLAAIAVLAAIVWATVRTTARNKGDGGDNAEDVLKRRFARGEIEKDEYEQRLKDLRK